MASPIENLHTFDLHIHVGTRSWPDDVERYCEVTFPGRDAEHPIEINYMWSANPGYSLEAAIKRASEDIRSYMHDPGQWREDYIKQHGTVWEKRRELELEIELYQKGIAENHKAIALCQEHIAQVEKRIQALHAEER